MTLKGHPILWAGPPWGWPAWRRAIPSEQDRLFHVHNVLTQFGQEVRYWDVVNEPLHFSTISIDKPYRLAREIAPRCHLIINDFGALLRIPSAFFRDAKASLGSRNSL